MRSRPWLVPGIAVALDAILSYLIADATGDAKWYMLVAVVAILSGAWYARGRANGGRQRNRNRDRR